MPNQTSQKSVARHGIATGARVDPETFAALLSEAKRLNRSVGHVAAIILRWWREDEWEPAQKGEK